MFIQNKISISTLIGGGGGIDTSIGEILSATTMGYLSEIKIIGVASEDHASVFDINLEGDRIENYNYNYGIVDYLEGELITEEELSGTVNLFLNIDNTEINGEYATNITEKQIGTEKPNAEFSVYKKVTGGIISAKTTE